MFLTYLFNPETGELRRETSETEAMRLAKLGWRSIPESAYNRLAEAERLLGALIEEAEIVSYDYWDCGPEAIDCDCCGASLVKKDRRHPNGVDKLPEDIRHAPLDWHKDECAYAQARAFLSGKVGAA